MTKAEDKETGIELRLLRYVLTVAEELHFGRAAERLNLSAPTLSKQIRQLERRLNYPLFERGTRRVSLTRAGEAFVEQARDVFPTVRRAVYSGESAHRRQWNRLRVGYSPWMQPSRILPHASFEGFVPEALSIDWVSLQPVDQIRLLREGFLDAGIVESAGPADLLAFDLASDEFVLAIPRIHRLTDLPEISGRDLVGQCLIAADAAVNPELASVAAKVFGRRDKEDGLTVHVTNWFELIDLVASGRGIGLMTRTASAICPTSVVIRNLPDPSPTIACRLFVASGLTAEIVGQLKHVIASVSRE